MIKLLVLEEGEPTELSRHPSTADCDVVIQKYKNMYKVLRSKDKERFPLTGFVSIHTLQAVR